MIVSSLRLESHDKVSIVLTLGGKDVDKLKTNANLTPERLEMLLRNAIAQLMEPQEAEK